jgi:hypothetical protein
MKTLLILALAFSTSAMASELDNEGQVINQELQGTAVVRVDTRTGEVATLKSDAVVTSANEAAALLAGEFEVLPTKLVKSELDTDGGSSSWYVYWYRYSYSYTPVYAYYGNYWQPYYSYSYSYYTYYYYGHYSRWW